MRTHRGGHGRQHCFHHLRLDTGRRVSRDVHAGRVRAGRDRLYAREERGAHHDDELHGVRYRDACLLGRGLRPAGGWRGAARDAGWLRSAVARSLGDDRWEVVGSVRHDGVLSDRRRLHRARLRLLPVPDGLHGYRGDHPDGSTGRTLEVRRVRRIQCVRRRGDLPDLRELDLGPRRGKYNRDGTANAIPGHNIPMALVGTFILAFGWFGFNAGSTLAGSDLRIGVIATNTMLAGAAGSITAMLYMWFKYGKPDPSMMANGALAGLVAITAPCAFVTAPSAVLIGGVAGVLVCVAVVFIERTLKIDDPVGASSVHGVCGAWGVLSLGLLADGTYGDGTNGVAGNVTGLFYGDPSQFGAQCIGVVT